MKKLVEDISALTSIATNSLLNLVDLATCCISHDVLESIIEKNSTTEVDIGVGTLYIKLEGDEIKYKFIPSKKLEESVLKTVTYNLDHLVSKVESSLKKKIENTYKNLL
jgi:hypothetical protein